MLGFAVGGGGGGGERMALTTDGSLVAAAGGVAMPVVVVVSKAKIKKLKIGWKKMRAAKYALLKDQKFIFTQTNRHAMGVGKMQSIENIYLPSTFLHGT